MGKVGAEVEAGPETDRLVAEACGFEVYIDDDGFCSRVLPREGGRPARAVRFRPSTDWTAAMLAAERFGLFKQPHRAALSNPDEWFVYEWDSVPDHDLCYASAPTGPLAICRAILALRDR